MFQIKRFIHATSSTFTWFIFSHLAECPRGTYQEGYQCIKCPVGKYQEKTGSVSCNQCPDNKITSQEGARSKDSCYGKLSVRWVPYEQQVIKDVFIVFPSGHASKEIDQIAY